MKITKAWRRWRGLDPSTRANIKLVVIVSTFLLCVVIADQIGLTNHA